jgi:hypothetical protein
MDAEIQSTTKNIQQKKNKEFITQMNPSQGRISIHMDMDCFLTKT